MELRVLPGTTGILCGALLVGLLAAGPAFAEDDEEPDDTYSRTHFYAGLGGAFLLENARNDLTQPPGQSVGNAGSFGARGGLRFARYAAIEIESQGFWGFENSPGFITTANLKIFGLAGRVQPFAKAGAGMLVYYPKNGGARAAGGFRFGMGVDFFITEHIAVEAVGEYVLGQGEAQDLRYGALGLGAAYHF